MRIADTKYFFSRHLEPDTTRNFDPMLRLPVTYFITDEGSKFIKKGTYRKKYHIS